MYLFIDLSNLMLGTVLERHFADAIRKQRRNFISRAVGNGRVRSKFQLDESDIANKAAGKQGCQVKIRW